MPSSLLSILEFSVVYLHYVVAIKILFAMVPVLGLYFHNDSPQWCCIKN